MPPRKKPSSRPKAKKQPKRKSPPRKPASRRQVQRKSSPKGRKRQSSKSKKRQTPKGRRKQAPKRQTSVGRKPQTSRSSRTVPTNKASAGNVSSQFVPQEKPIQLGSLGENIAINGLKSFTVWENKKYNKIIYLLGEYHTTLGSCPANIPNQITAPEFFFSLLNSTNKLLDVIMELPIHAVAKKKHDKKLMFLFDYQGKGGMTSTFASLLNKRCIINTSNSNCGYLNHVRFHAVDVRRYEPLAPVMKFYDLIASIVFFKDPPIPIVNELSKLKPSLWKFEDNTAGDIIRRYFNLFKISKQLNNISDSNVASRIVEEFTNSVKTYVNDFPLAINPVEAINKMEELVRSVDRNNKKLVEHKIRMYAGEAITIVTGILAVLMDVYALARMFRTYRNVLGQLNGDPTNIIVYTGNTHTLFYQRVLTQLGFDMVEEAKQINTSEQCLLAKSFKPKWI